MATIDLSDVVSDPDMAETFTILRSKGGFVSGGWEDSRSSIAGYGVVSVAEQKDLNMLPEGTQVSEARVFHSIQNMILINETNLNLSDILVWNGVKYLAHKSADYSNFGYYRAIAVRMEGS